MKYKSLYISFFLGILASECFGQDLKISELEKVEVGRQYVITVEAEFEGETADLLIDVDGKLDYNFFEGNTKICFTPTAKGDIKIKIVSIWWNAKKADQRVVKINVESGEGANPPPVDEEPEPDTGSEYKELTSNVSALADKLADPYGRDALKAIYLELSKAVESKTIVSVTYFGKVYSYDMAGDLAMVDNSNLAVSRAMALAKSQNKDTDKADWSDKFLAPLQGLSKKFNLQDRVVFSKFLKAVADGL